jgi:hypothetical protein
VIRDILDRGLNVMGNLIAKRRMGSETRYSMSCNAGFSPRFPSVRILPRRRLSSEKP